MTAVKYIFKRKLFHKFWSGLSNTYSMCGISNIFIVSGIDCVEKSKLIRLSIDVARCLTA